MLLMLLTCRIASAEIAVSEIMYNPSAVMGDDSDLEWIELFNNGTQEFNLSNWKVDGNSMGNTLIQINSYIIIAKELKDGTDSDNRSFESYYGNNDGVWDSNDGNYSVIEIRPLSLTNSFDMINLSNGTNSILIYYNSTIGADGNGYSLIVDDEMLIEGKAYGGNPGKSDKESDEIIVGNMTDTLNTTIINSTEPAILRLTVNIDSIIYPGRTYTSLFKIENLNHKTGETDDINLTIHYTIAYHDTNESSESDNTIIGLNSIRTANTGLFYPSREGNITLCGKIINSTTKENFSDDSYECKEVHIKDTMQLPCNTSLEIETERTLFLDEETISFKNEVKGDSYPYTIEYWAEDLFGRIVKNKINTSNTNKKSFSLKLLENDQAFIIKGILYPDCNDLNLSDNHYEKLILTKRAEWKEIDVISIASLEKSYENYTTDLDLGFASDSEDGVMQFGDSIKLDITIIKGDTNKKQVKLGIEDKNNKRINSLFAFNVNSKYINESITIPLTIPENCDSKLDDGSYNIVLEGLGIRKEMEIIIKGRDEKACKNLIKEITQDKEPNVQYAREKEYLLLELVNFEETVNVNKEFTNVINIQNTFNGPKKIYLYSYAYRGKKSYSGERVANKIMILLYSGQEKNILLKNRITGAEPGDYKLKVNMADEEDKVIGSITKDIVVTDIPNEISDVNNVLSQKEATGTPVQPEVSCIEKTRIVTIYESSNVKLKNLFVYLSFPLLIMLNIVVWTNNKNKQ